jgi:MYXO-CTERM domain-containing protein
VGLVDAAETATPNSNAVMIGNVVVSKPRGAAWNHGRFVWFGQDSGGAHDGSLYAINNTFVAGDSRIYFLDANVANALVVAVNNVFVNSNTIAGTGTGSVVGQNNWIPSSAAVPTGFNATRQGANPGFVDGPARNFHLIASSPLIGGGFSAPAYLDGNGASQSGVPVFEYVLDLAHSARPIDATLDIGAYEYATVPDGGGAGGATGTGGSANGGAPAAGGTNGGTGGSATASGGAGGAANDSGVGGSPAGNGGAGTAGAGGTSPGGSPGNGGVAAGGGGSGNGGGNAAAGRSPGGGASGAPANGTGASAGSRVDAGSATATAEDSGGCGCVLAGQTSRHSTWVFALVAVAGAARRRRRLG